MEFPEVIKKKSCGISGAIALSYPPPPIVIDDSSLKIAAESFTVALTLTLGGYKSAIAPNFQGPWLGLRISENFRRSS